MEEIQGKKGKNEWKRCLLELPEELFFSIMHTYLGKIQTPFHKPRLVDRLEAFLNDPETIERAIALIDEYDAELLTAIALLKNPDPAILFRFFEGDKDYFAFHNHLLNLQDRLLIFTCPEDRSLYLNPFFLAALEEDVIAPVLLFPPAEKIGTTSSGKMPAPWAGEALVWGLLSFFQHQPEALKNDGTLKKKSAGTIGKIFPTITGDGDMEKIYLMLNSMRQMELIEFHSGSFSSQPEQLSRFGSLPRPIRLSIIWIVLSKQEDRARERVIFDQPIDRKDELENATFFLRSLENMPVDTVFTRSSIQRLFFVSASRTEQGEEGWFPISSHMFSLMTELNIFIPHRGNFYLNPEIKEILQQEEHEQPLIIHPDFSVTLQTPLKFSDGIFISEVMKLVSNTAYPQYELNNESYVHGRKKYSFKAIKARIEQLSTTPLPQNIDISMQAWEHSYSSVEMIEGITLILAEHWDRMVIHLPEFKEHIIKELGHGIYIMDPHTKKSWRGIMEEIGVSPLPPIRRASKYKEQSQSAPPQNRSDASKSAHHEAKRWSTESSSSLEEDFNFQLSFPREKSRHKSAEILKQLEEELSKLKSQRGRGKELATRLKQKLFLFPFQLQHPIPNESTSEARGIDYAGKVRIIQQALQAKGSLLEIVKRTAPGKPLRLLIQPQELQKTENELILVGIELPKREEVRIRVDKIGYIKRWKGSLFIQAKDYKNS